MDRTVTITEGEHVLRLRLTLGAFYRLETDHALTDENADKALLSPTGLRAIVIEGHRGYREFKGDDPDSVTDQDGLTLAAPFARNQLMEAAGEAWKRGLMSRELTPEEIEAGKERLAAASTGANSE